MKKIILPVAIVLPMVLYAQNRSISGTVKDKQGYPVVGASVYVPNSVVGEKLTDETISNNALGTITDEQGNFKLEIPKSAKQLTFSYDGFETETIHLSQKNIYHIVLKSFFDDINLKEIVTTGYQKIEKRKLASSVVDISMDKINQKGISTIDQMLQGQAAGVAVSTQTGAPGQLASIQIRGNSSLNGVKDPLWVIDGVPMEGNDVPDLKDKNNLDDLRNYSIAGLNPEDIESITILKDASATSIYGARAANGVINVVTKRGKKGNLKINITANTFINFMPNFDRINLLNSNEKVDFELALAKRTDLSFRSGNGDVARILSAANELDNYKNGKGLSAETLAKINALRNNQVNWWKELYHTSINQQYSASFSGGGERNNYYFSLGYYDEKASLQQVGFQRFNLTLKDDFRLNDKIKLGVSAIGASIIQNKYLTDASAFTNPNFYSRVVNPYQLVYNPNGSYAYDENISPDLKANSDFVKFNIIEERENTKNSLKTLQMMTNFDLEYKISKGTTFNSLLGLQVERNRGEKFANENSYYNRAYIAGSRYYDSSSKTNKYWLPLGGILKNSSTDFFNYMWRNSLNFEKKIGRSELSGLAGVEIRKDKKEIINTNTFGYNDRNLNNTPVVFRNSSDALSESYRPFKKFEYENAYVSFFGTASYTYDNRYTVFGSLRYDGSNLFGVDPKYKYLPIWSVAGAWNISNETFFEPAKEIVSNLRLRTSYGFQGNIDKTTSPFVVGTYSTASITPGNTENTIVVLSPPNDKLRWEKTENLGFGMDLGLFKNRVNLVLDWYNRKSTDLITLKNLPQETGFLRTAINYGSINNRGFEIGINTTNISNEDFKWTTSFNISSNRNELVSAQPTPNQKRPLGIGKPSDAIWTVPYAGLDQNGLPVFEKDGKTVSTDEFFALEDPYAAFAPGYFVQSNLSNDQRLELFKYQGYNSPKWFGGLSNNFIYKNFEFGFSGTFVIKKTVLAQPSYNFTQVDPGQNYQNEILNAWSPENTSSSLPRIIGRDTPNAGNAYNWFGGIDEMNTFYAFQNLAKSMSYFRFTSIRLGYDFTKEWLRQAGISNVKFSVEGRNLFVISNGHKNYFDPETYGSIYAQPIQKSVTIGFNLQF